jgi:hypothetical protein
MASYLKPGEAKRYAPWLAELRASSTLDGRAVESWSHETSDDGLSLLISVTFAPLNPAHQGPLGAFTPTNFGITETYKFSALAVARLVELEAKNAS